MPFETRFRFGILMSAIVAVVVFGIPEKAEAQRKSSRDMHSHTARMRAVRPNEVYVAGHWAWSRRHGQYEWVPSRWERNRRGAAHLGMRWTNRSGHWTLEPGR